MSSDDDYEIGYGRPPKDSQFKKGQSGNTGGRPKSRRNFSTVAREVLEAKVPIVENGRPKNVSAQMAALMRLREKALKGDSRSIDTLIKLAQEIGAEDQGRAAEHKLAKTDSDILERYLEARRQADDGETFAEGAGDDPRS